jgi:hypothetical protein
MNISRDVIIDLWPLYIAGEAGADTRSLVDEYLQRDPDFARQLQETPDLDLLRTVAPPLPPDREARAFNRTKRLLHGWDWSLILLMEARLFSSFAFGRIVSDSSWDVSPRNFIITAVIAAGFCGSGGSSTASLPNLAK